jgi:hypothetical protein
MPSNYEGDPTLASDAAPTIAVPVDADPRNASSVQVPLRSLADAIAYLAERAHPNVALAGLTRVLVQEIDDNRTGLKTRLFVTLNGEPEITRNARWSEVTGWTADVWVPGYANSASLWRLSGTGASLMTYGHPSHDLTDPTYSWGDLAWRVQARLDKNAVFKFFETIDGSTDGVSNPTADVPQANTICAKNVIKSWGSVRLDAGVAALLDGFNAAGAERLTNILRVAFPAGGAMHDTSYAVTLADTSRHVSGEGSGSGVPWCVYSKATGYFDVVLPGVDLSTGVRGFDFQILGRQDT